MSATIERTPKLLAELMAIRAAVKRILAACEDAAQDDPDKEKGAADGVRTRHA